MSFTNLFCSAYIATSLLHVLTFSVPALDVSDDSRRCRYRSDKPECKPNPVEIVQKREKPKDNGNPPKRDLLARWCKVNETPKTHNCQDGSGSGAWS